MNRRNRQIQLEALPAYTVIKGDIDAGFRPRIQQARARRVTANNAGEVIVGDAGIDARP